MHDDLVGISGIDFFRFLSQHEAGGYHVSDIPLVDNEISVEQSVKCVKGHEESLIFLDSKLQEIVGQLLHNSSSKFSANILCIV